MRKSWSVDSETQALARPMTPEELADWKAGYPASRYRRRAIFLKDHPGGEREAIAFEIRRAA